jgi:hypothetical protein
VNELKFHGDSRPVTKGDGVVENCKHGLLAGGNSMMKVATEPMLQ